MIVATHAHRVVRWRVRFGCEDSLETPSIRGVLCALPVTARVGDLLKHAALQHLLLGLGYDTAAIRLRLGDSILDPSEVLSELATEDTTLHLAEPKASRRRAEEPVDRPEARESAERPWPAACEVGSWVAVTREPVPWELVRYRVRSADGLSPLLVGRCIGREISASGPVCVLVHGDGLTRRVPVEDLLQVSLAVEA
eukprot:TRINITY_DN15970_c0_g1_i1.p1 TRINITY_DN15970_c0_g1~~TRINITY_DN15970_c0_g1_i1.p1  ORF type:complete len:197 (+),score=13.56 TRINITY_DN15970_c0_g1_i1:40-630(+)